jgi:hypothetical protein
LKNGMATAIAVDTLAFSKKLRDSGFTEQQADTLAQAQAETITDALNA